ncbi:MAG: hypothetical protein R3A10_12785 [Caldilineaceae bacterium]
MATSTSSGAGTGARLAAYFDFPGGDEVEAAPRRRRRHGGHGVGFQGWDGGPTGTPLMMMSSPSVCAHVGETGSIPAGIGVAAPTGGRRPGTWARRSPGDSRPVGRRKLSMTAAAFHHDAADAQLRQRPEQTRSICPAVEGRSSRVAPWAGSAAGR